MIKKNLSRNIPQKRENQNESFRVNYGSRNDFDVLVVTITRIATGEVQVFEFDASKLPASDSIHFSTSVHLGKLKVHWRGINANIGKTTLVSSEKKINPIMDEMSIPENKQPGSANKECFPPISDKNANILILGTMPGERSLALNQYYGHGGNQFWPILFKLFNIPESSNYEHKRQLLLNHRIALWDVLKACEREGSSDNAIIKEEPNDFKTFFKNHPEIKQVFFNGKNAQAYYDKYVGIKDGHKFITLPSTSRMNSWTTLEEKYDEWQKILG